MSTRSERALTCAEIKRETKQLLEYSDPEEGEIEFLPQPPPVPRRRIQQGDFGPPMNRSTPLPCNLGSTSDCAPPQNPEPSRRPVPLDDCLTGGEIAEVRALMEANSRRNRGRGRSHLTHGPQVLSHPTRGHRQRGRHTHPRRGYTYRNRNFHPYQTVQPEREAPAHVRNNRLLNQISDIIFDYDGRRFDVSEIKEMINSFKKK